MDFFLHENEKTTSFNHTGSYVLEVLVEHCSDDMLRTSTTLRAVLRFKWQSFGRTMYMKRAWIYLSYLVSFSIFGTLASTPYTGILPTADNVNATRGSVQGEMDLWPCDRLQGFDVAIGILVCLLVLHLWLDYASWPCIARKLWEWRCRVGIACWRVARCSPLITMSSYFHTSRCPVNCCRPWFLCRQGKRVRILVWAVVVCAFAVIVVCSRVLESELLMWPWLPKWCFLWLLPCTGLSYMRRPWRRCRDVSFKRYISSAWNLIELAAILPSIVLSSLHLSSVLRVSAGLSHPEQLAPFTSMTMVFLWVHVLFFFRAWRRFGPLLVMIGQITRGMTTFLVVFMILLVGLSHGWATMALSFTDSHLLQVEDEFACIIDVDDPSLSTCNSDAQVFSSMATRLFASFTLMYRLAVLGDVDSEVFALGDFSGIHGDKPELKTAVIAWIFFFVGTLFFLVVLLNLLIAMMSDWYGEIQQRMVPVFMRERARICLELERELARDVSRRSDIELFPKYLFVSFSAELAKDTNHGGIRTDVVDAEDEWEGQARYLEKRVGKPILDKLELMGAHLKVLDSVLKEVRFSGERVDAYVTQSAVLP